MAHSPALFETLRDAQRFGFFGDRPIDEAIAHAGHFVTALADVPHGASVIDLGAGGGLPGLVLAEARPDLHLVLLDRRQKRTDFLQRAVQRLDFERVEVWHRDAEDVVVDVSLGRHSPFDGAVARGFGPPEVTLRTAVGVVRRAGVVVISEPPTGDRWGGAILDELGVEVETRGTVVRFRVVAG